MPELPEVEAARVLVHKECCGKVVKSATFTDDAKVFSGMSPSELEAVFKNSTLNAVHRLGKYLWFELGTSKPEDTPDEEKSAKNEEKTDDNGDQTGEEDGESSKEERVPVLHFGMAGALVVKGIDSIVYRSSKVDTSGEWPPKYWKFVLEFGDGCELAFVDFRRFAKLQLVTDPPTECKPLNQMGFDPLKNMLSLEDFTEKIKKKKGGKIKAVLLDQAFSAGIGNWMADEILYHARIHPEQALKDLTDDQITALHDKINYVTQTSVEAGADSDKYPEGWLFHVRWTGKKETELEGKKVEFISVGSRTSAFVPELQKYVGEEKPKRTKRKAASGSDAEKVGSSNGEEDSNEKEAQPSRTRRSKKQDPADGQQQAAEPAKPTEPAKKGRPARRGAKKAAEKPEGDNANNEVAEQDNEDSKSKPRRSTRAKKTAAPTEAQPKKQTAGRKRRVNQSDTAKEAAGKVTKKRGRSKATDADDQKDEPQETKRSGRGGRRNARQAKKEEKQDKEGEQDELDGDSMEEDAPEAGPSSPSKKREREETDAPDADQSEESPAKKSKKDAGDDQKNDLEGAKDGSEVDNAEKGEPKTKRSGHAGKKRGRGGKFDSEPAVGVRKSKRIAAHSQKDS